MKTKSPIPQPTPGPWSVGLWETTNDKGGFESFACVEHKNEDGSTDYVCDCWGLEDEETHGVKLPSAKARANARLIAAAPEMLEALRAVSVRLVEWMEIAEQADKRPADYKAMRLARAALRKAEKGAKA